MRYPPGRLASVRQSRNNKLAKNCGLCPHTLICMRILSSRPQPTHEATGISEKSRLSQVIHCAVTLSHFLNSPLDSFSLFATSILENGPVLAFELDRNLFLKFSNRFNKVFCFDAQSCCILMTSKFFA